MAQADPSQVAGLARFFKTGPGQYGEGDKFLGIKVPVTRAVVKECWRSASWEDLEACIGSEYHELRLAALLTIVEIFKHKKADRQRCIDFYLSHTDRINNWDLVDLSCYPLLGEWLLEEDGSCTPGGIRRSRKILYNLAANGKTLWEQRIGIVSTMAFIRHGSWPIRSPLPISSCTIPTTSSTRRWVGCCGRPGSGTRLRWRPIWRPGTSLCRARCFGMPSRNFRNTSGNHTFSVAVPAENVYLRR